MGSEEPGGTWIAHLRTRSRCWNESAVPPYIHKGRWVREHGRAPANGWPENNGLRPGAEGAVGGKKQQPASLRSKHCWKSW